MESFLGFHEDALVGKRFIIGSMELRVRLPKPGWIETHLSMRYYLGGIWGRYSNISIKDFKHGIGFLLSLDTPLGPVQTGLGRTNEGKNLVYFSAGYRF
jgi:outer membrane translocation and assembly module TamA